MHLVDSASFELLKKSPLIYMYLILYCPAFTSKCRLKVVCIAGIILH